MQVEVMDLLDLLLREALQQQVSIHLKCYCCCRLSLL